MNLATADFFLSSPNHLTLSTRLLSELGNSHSKLRATTQRSGSAVVVYAGGEIDACNESTWRRLLAEAATAVTPPGTLVIDTSGLGFMGCCAFSVLADQVEACGRRGIELCLVSCQAEVPRIVEACGLHALLTVHPTVDSALATEIGAYTPVL
jgi:anti-anti-sigma factor